MNTKMIILALFSLLAGTFSPASALAERDDGDYRDRQQQSQREHRETRQTTQPQRVERQSPQRVERQSPQRVERQSPQRVERQSPQRVERQRPVIMQHYSYNQRATARPETRHHIVTRRTFHIVKARHIVKPSYYHRVPRSRYYMGIRIYRPYGYLYPGFGFYYSDHDAFRWIAFTALTLTIIDHLDEYQQRMHEQAIIRATSADIGDTLYWHDGHTSGSVTVLHIGTDTRGRKYREFRQIVSVRGKTQTSYGSAYLKSNGTW